MADTKISAYSTKILPANGDFTVVVDSVGGANKKVTIGTVLGGANPTEVGYCSGVTAGIQTAIDDLDSAIAAVASAAPVVTNITSSATPTPIVGTTGQNIQYNLTALATAAVFAAPTGTPLSGQKLTIRILDNGGAQTLGWNSGAGGYIARGVVLPNTTVAGKYTYLGFIYNAVAAKWECVASSQEA